MPSTFRKSALTAALVSLLLPLLSACSVKPPENLGKVEYGQNATSGGVSAPSGTMTLTGPAATGERYDPAQEEAIGERSLAAWRAAVAHAKKPADLPQPDWSKQRAKDEKESMDQLETLAKEFPGSSTVQFMMGQVKEHFGKREEAVKYFQAAMQNNTNNMMYLFKLAENERKTHQLDSAINHYREVLKIQPDFYAAKLGLANSLQERDPASGEAVTLATEVLKAENGNDATKQAKEIISRGANKSNK